MDAIRLSITVPKELASSLAAVTGPRGRSRFIRKAIQQAVEAEKKRRLENLLSEGYRAGSQEAWEAAAEFEPCDLEGWDDY